MKSSKQKEKEDFYKFFKPQLTPKLYFSGLIILLYKITYEEHMEKMEQKPLQLLVFISFKPTYSMISTVRHY